MRRSQSFLGKRRACNYTAGVATLLTSKKCTSPCPLTFPLTGRCQVKLTEFFKAVLEQRRASEAGASLQPEPSEEGGSVDSAAGTAGPSASQAPPGMSSGSPSGASGDEASPTSCPTDAVLFCPEQKGHQDA